MSSSRRVCQRKYWRGFQVKKLNRKELKKCTAGCHQHKNDINFIVFLEMTEPLSLWPSGIGSCLGRNRL